MLGSYLDDDKVTQVLNRTIRWTDQGIEVRGDERHMEIIIDQLGLDKERPAGVSTPGAD